jgi:hypothetical protein
MRNDLLVLMHGWLPQAANRASTLSKMYVVRAANFAAAQGTVV